MKKKALMAILALCVAMAMAACGGNADTIEVKDAEGDTQAEADAEDSAAGEESAESEQTEEEAPENEEPFREIEIGADGSVDGQEFPVIDEAVLSADKSEEYGVNSISCYDLDQYLDENGNLQPDIASAENFYFEYSGRWAYPEITPCRFFGELVLTSRTDSSSEYMSVDSETGDQFSFSVYSGKDLYNGAVGNIGYDFGDDSTFIEKAFTIQTVDGEADVTREYREIMMLKDKGENGEALETPEEVIYNFSSYTFVIGNFSVSLAPNVGTELTQEEVQLIADNIRLTNGMER